MIDFSLARRMMVDGQVRTQDVTDRRVLAAMETMPRERFVPPDLASLAYLDRDLVIREGSEGPARYLLKPMVVARLVQAAEVAPEDRVLDVGCATGYSAAVLAQLAGTVVALEEDEALAQAADRALASLGIPNVTLRTGPLALGAPEEAPYDAILINGAIEELPDGFRRQLKDGGRLVCVMRDGPVGRAMLFRSAGDLSGRPLFDIGAHVLPGFARRPSFVF